MSVLSVTCPCGQRLRVDPGHAGLAIRCRSCGRTLRVKAPGPGARLRLAVSACTSAGRAVVTGLDLLLRRNVQAVRYFREAPVALRATLVVTWLWVAAVGGGAALMWMQGDSGLAGTVLLYSGRWIWLLPLVLIVPLVWLTGRELFLPLGIGLVLALGPLMGFRTGWRRLVPTGDGRVLRIVSLNAGQGDAVTMELQQFLTEWKPGVVAFQECGESLTLATRRLRGWFHHDTTGLCLLSRYPIEAVEVMDRSSLQRVRDDTVSKIGGAGFVVRYALQSPAGPIGLTNLHLETARKGFEALGSGDLRRYALNAELRDIESNRARHWVDGGPGPYLVVGDFNLPVESRIFRDHWGDMNDAFTRTGIGFGYTRYNGWIRIRIDHVLMSPGWRPLRAWVGHDVGSDHRPLIVDVLRGTR